MDKLVFLLLLVVVKMVFMMIPFSTETHAFFPLSGVEIGIHTYVYFLLEHIGYCLLAYMIYAESEKHRVGLFTFFALMCADTIDYLLTYNSAWFKVNGLPITMNVAFCFIFGLALIWEAYKNE